MGPESEEKKEMLIIDGNAFYEIDLECVKKKKQCAQTVHPEKKTDRINSRNMKDKDNIRQHYSGPFYNLAINQLYQIRTITEEMNKATE